MSAQRTSVVYTALLLSSICCILAILLQSCSFLEQNFNSTMDIRVDIAPDANQNNPIAVDILLIEDATLLQQVLSMSASEWFSKREQVRADYPDSTGFRLWGWEWIPGQQVADIHIPYNIRAEGAVVFARYFSGGTHRARIDPFKNIVLSFKEKDFTISSYR
jgi:type VI secretion system protein